MTCELAGPQPHLSLIYAPPMTYIVWSERLRISRQCKRGQFGEGLHRRKSCRSCKLHNFKQCHRARNREKVWHIKVYRSYRCNDIDRFACVIKSIKNGMATELQAAMPFLLNRIAQVICIISLHIFEKTDLPSFSILLACWLDFQKNYPLLCT